MICWYWKIAHKPMVLTCRGARQVIGGMRQHRDFIPERTSAPWAMAVLCTATDDPGLAKLVRALGNYGSSIKNYSMILRA